jgi:hypothetical protein
MPAPDCASLHPGYKLRSSTAYSRGLISTGALSQDPANFLFGENAKHRKRRYRLMSDLGQTSKPGRGSNPLRQPAR